MENKYKCLVVDDESPAHLVIKSHIDRSEKLTFVDSVYNGKEAIEKLRNHTYDIVFLDIEMPLFSGIEVLQTLPIRPATIITTAFTDFAFDAYQLEAADYLLKPISYPRFLKATEKAIALLEAKDKKTEAIKFISYKVDGYLQNIALDDISYFQSIGNYIKIYFTNPQKPILIYDSLKNLIENLPKDNFIQTHKSYIVNINTIVSITKENINLKNNLILPLGRKYELITQLNLKTNVR